MESLQNFGIARRPSTMQTVLAVRARMRDERARRHLEVLVGHENALNLIEDAFTGDEETLKLVLQTIIKYQPMAGNPLHLEGRMGVDPVIADEPFSILDFPATYLMEDGRSSSLGVPCPFLALFGDGLSWRCPSTPVIDLSGLRTESSSIRLDEFHRPRTESSSIPVVEFHRPRTESSSIRLDEFFRPRTESSSIRLVEFLRPRTESSSIRLDEFHRPRTESSSMPVPEFHRPRTESLSILVDEFPGQRTESSSTTVDEFQGPRTESFSILVDEFHGQRTESYSTPVDEFQGPRTESFSILVDEFHGQRTESSSTPVDELQGPRTESFSILVDEFHGQRTESSSTPVDEFRRPRTESFSILVDEFHRRRTESSSIPVVEFHRPRTESSAIRVDEFHRPRTESSSILAHPIQKQMKNLLIASVAIFAANCNIMVSLKDGDTALERAVLIACTFSWMLTLLLILASFAAPSLNHTKAKIVVGLAGFLTACSHLVLVAMKFDSISKDTVWMGSLAAFAFSAAIVFLTCTTKTASDPGTLDGAGRV